MKKISIALIILLFSFVLLGFHTNVFGKDITSITVKKRLMSGDGKIIVKSFQDPDMPFITIFLTTIKSGKIFAMADPSNNCVATRLTGPLGKVVTKKRKEVISLSKSIGSKEIKIDRYYDKENDTLIYVTYSTKMIGGSYKHSMSVVPLNRIERNRDVNH